MSGAGQGKYGYDPARRAAAAALLRVHKGGWAGMAAGALAQGGLDGQKRAFAGALFFGAAERLVTLDYLLAPFLAKPVGRLDAEIRAVLECGLYQLAYMRVPAGAAVNESVKLARAFGKGSAAGLVNAVLRKCAGLYGGEGGPNFSAMHFTGECQRVCVTYSVSAPVAEAIMAALPNEYDAFFSAGFSKGALCLRANTLRTTAPALADMMPERAPRAGNLFGALYAAPAGAVKEDALFLKGFYHVQGEASQYACACLGAGPGMRVLDVCAAPGGKSATLAQQMGGGAGLAACDVRPHRLRLIQELFGRLGISGARVMLNDAVEYCEALGGQDRVLCDVPCSGLGVLSEKPDLRYANGNGFGVLPALQLKILAVAARYVKRGGRLVYATCTVREEENGDVVKEFLRQNKAFSLAPPLAAPAGALISDGMVTLLPHRTGLDGFFVATMERL